MLFKKLESIHEARLMLEQLLSMSAALLFALYLANVILFKWNSALLPAIALNVATIVWLAITSHNLWLWNKKLADLRGVKLFTRKGLELATLEEERAIIGVRENVS